MAYVEDAVRKSGYPGFSATRSLQKRKAHCLQGVASAPLRAIQIFNPHAEVSPAHEQTGTLEAFGHALSEAIQRPVSIPPELQDLRLTWQDNSRAYLDLGGNITDQMISSLLDDVSAALGVTFTDFEVELSVWWLRLER